MATWIKSIEATGIYGRFDLSQEFEPGVNILFGKNGSGKTTVLHILANILNADYTQFAFLEFDTILVRLDDDTTIFLEQHSLGYEPDIEVVCSINSEPMFAFTGNQARELMEPPATSTPARVADGGLILHEPLLPAAYFPAFRAMIEAWVSSDREWIGEWQVVHPGRDKKVTISRNKRTHNRATKFARRSFNQFVPEVNYPSPLEIEEHLKGEIRNALLEVGRVDRMVLSHAFRDIYVWLHSHEKHENASTEAISEEIRQLSEKVKESSLTIQSDQTAGVLELLDLVDVAEVQEDKQQFAAPVLDVYRHSLQEIVSVQEKAFEGVKRYLDAVNSFLEDKKLEIEGERIEVRFDDGTPLESRSLSSGERQIITLLYAATHMSSNEIVLVDEPEISLHVDWQRSLLKKMSEQLPGRQIIVATHSPVIGADFRDRLKELKMRQTQHISSSMENHEESEEMESEVMSL